MPFLLQTLTKNHGRCFAIVTQCKKYLTTNNCCYYKFNCVSQQTLLPRQISCDFGVEQLVISSSKKSKWIFSENHARRLSCVSVATTRLYDERRRRQIEFIDCKNYTNTVLLSLPSLFNSSPGKKIRRTKNYNKNKQHSHSNNKNNEKSQGQQLKEKVYAKMSHSLSLPIPIASSHRNDGRSESPTPSPTMDHSPRDDISALTMGFEKFQPLNRRRLSTATDLSSHTKTNNNDTTSESFRKSSSSSDSMENTIAAWLAARSQSQRLSECEEDELSSSSSTGGDGNKSSSGGGGGPKLPKDDIFALLEKTLQFRGRNVSHITVEQSVKDLCTAYNDTDELDKQKLFQMLAENYGVNNESVSALANSLILAKDENASLNLQDKLRTALVPQYHWLFSQIGRLENGVKFLIDFRTDLLDALQQLHSENSTHLKALNNCLRDLIGMWFAVGFLLLERVTWQSSCDMLQKISEYEAVHPMRRVGAYRRCFVFTHGSMPTEPVVVLHTALMDHIPSSIKKIVSIKRMTSLDPEIECSSTPREDPEFINTAAFYSITSTQRGLMGIELGNYLIKRTVKELQGEFPKMNQFSSLSPIPGFRNWLVGELKSAQRDTATQNLFTPHEMEIFASIFKVELDDHSEVLTSLMSMFKLNEWYSSEELVKELETPLMRICAHYLYLVKRRGYALDAVANFHLKNGAVLWRLNWLADTSPRGLTQSCGMMVNYRYFLEACELNSQNYMEKQVIQTSDQIRHLIRLEQHPSKM